MTTAQDSVVTPQRYAQGRTWPQYLGYIGSPANLGRPSPSGERPNNSERFQRNMDQYTIKPQHVTALQALPPCKVLAIGEDWCPDVYRGLPVIARLAEAAGWELRLFQRDENPDIMAEFRKEVDGQSFDSIPVAVFYSAQDFRYLGHWIERPPSRQRRHRRHRQRVHPPRRRKEDDMRTRLRAALPSEDDMRTAPPRPLPRTDGTGLQHVRH